MIRLEQLRLDAELTVDELAEKADVHPRTIHRLEAGDGGAKDPTLFKLARALDARPSELLHAAVEPETGATA